MVETAPPPRSNPLWVWMFALNGVMFLVMLGTLVLFWNKILGPPAQPALTTAAPTPAATPAKPAVAKADEPEASPLPTAPEAPLDSGALTASDIVARVAPGIVYLECKDSQGKAGSIGSGFLIEGLAVTNYHVIRKASAVTATFSDGTTVPVKGCRAWDDRADLAILELERLPETARSLTFPPTDERKAAADVIAIGHPAGFKFTTTTGIISAVHKTSELPPAYRRGSLAPDDNVWLQTSAAISGGSSGGPLLDMQGHVVGVTTWIANGAALGFAADVRHVAQLKAEKLQSEAIALKDLTAPEETIEQLLAEFNGQYEWLTDELGKAETEEAVKTLVDEKHPALDFLPKIADFAQKHGKIPAKFFALYASCYLAALGECPKACGPDFKRAADQITAEYLDDPRLLDLVLMLRQSPLPESRDFLRQVEEKGTTPSLKGASLFALAVNLRMTGEDREKSTAESLALLERIEQDYADVDLRGTSLGEIVEPIIKQFKFYEVGRTPPDIVGLDPEGTEFKLSDSRGKVVLLNFFADWCPGCQALYPKFRELIKNRKDQPFALLSVNVDEPTRLKRVLAGKKVTWRCWADGPDGPIRRAWGVDAFPTLYILDHEGVIRHVQADPRKLDTLLDELVQKVPAAPATGAATP